ncbi:MAG: DMT family transporter [Leptolyngbya sp. SIOISBB]|nr:DMT family transporter [Leptolyngbya sp. SIOISBB]
MTQSSVSSPVSNSPDLRAIATLCIALIAVSLAPIFIRFSETDLGPNATVLNRMLVFLLVFGLGRGSWQLITQGRHQASVPSPSEPLTYQQYGLLVAVGLASITTLGLWAISLMYTSVAKSMLLNNLTPIFASVGSWLVLGKRFDARFVGGLAIAVGGALVLGLEDLQIGEMDTLVGDAYALLSAVFLAVYFLLVEHLRTRFSATTILLWRCAIGSLLLCPIVWLTEGHMWPTTGIGLLAVLGLGIISEGMGQNLLADCMAKFSSSFIALFLLLEPLVSAFLGWLIFAETLSPVTGIGFVVILGGIYLAKSSNCALQESLN